jgi:hypothetical protein
MLEECTMPKSEDNVKNLIPITKLGYGQKKYFLIDGMCLQVLRNGSPDHQISFQKFLESL